MSYKRVSQVGGNPGTAAQVAAGRAVTITSTSNYAGETIDALNAGILSANFPNLQPNVEFNSRPCNIDMHKRYIWLGACAPREDADGSWYFIGALKMWLGSALQLELPIKAGGYLAPGFGDCSRRYTGGGGQQPPINIRYAGSTAYERDIPCLTFTVRANRIALVPQAMNLPFTGNCYVFGYQLVSQNETL